MTATSKSLQLRAWAREIFDDALRAVDPCAALQQAVSLENGRFRIQSEDFELREPVYAIGIGKAAVALASGLDKAIGGRIKAGIISSTSSLRMPSHWSLYSGGHPEPNEQSLAAAEASFKLLDQANREAATVFFLISGGGSAMLEWPRSSEITLEDLRLTNRLLVTSAASIGEVNTVRRALSAVKGGHLAARAPNCNQITLIVSDVPRGEEHNVASGPTICSSQQTATAMEIVTRYDLRPRLPKSVLRAFESEPKNTESLPAEATTRDHLVLLENKTALEAAAEAARKKNLITKIAVGISDQRIDQGCSQLLADLDALSAEIQAQQTACLISGGEFACPVTGEGLGGRNLETALRLAIGYAQVNEPFVTLCAGTDGLDGNSPAAGAIVDHTTAARARAIGLDLGDFLRRSDSYSFFVALGDVVATGPTGTNVRDIRILLKARR